MHTEKKLFTDLGLSPEVLKAIDQMGFEEASPIQSEAIPVLLSGRDVVGQSQTGSGKTAAFAVPAIEAVDARKREPQVLIMCPTRELAVQVAEEVAKLAAFKRGVKELPIYGGQSYERQFRGLDAGAQIIIGTPGRLMDHLKRGSLKLGGLKMVILDEADRMLDMGFVDDIRTILEKAPEDRQTVFFSATLPAPIAELIRTFAKDPATVRIESQQMKAPDIEQVYYEVDRRTKVDALCRIIDIRDLKYGIIFCATKRMVDELTDHLIARGYTADKLHGDCTQAMRERVLGKFRKRAVEFLVATDVAARGLDVDDIEVVFNYDLPQDGEDYIHRIGRTGRAGRSGIAITLIGGREIYKLQYIMRFAKMRLKREHVPSAEEVEEKRSNLFFENVRATLEKGEYRRYDEYVDRLLGQGYTATDIASVLFHLLAGDEVESTAPVPETPKTSMQPKGPRKDKYAEFRGKQSENRRDESTESRTPPPREERPPREAREFQEPREFDRPQRRERNMNPHIPEQGMRRIVLSMGRENAISPGDVAGVISGAAKIPPGDIGIIKLFPRNTFVDVAEHHFRRALKSLEGIKFKGKILHVREWSEE